MLKYFPLKKAMSRLITATQTFFCLIKRQLRSLLNLIRVHLVMYEKIIFTKALTSMPKKVMM